MNYRTGVCPFCGVPINVAIQHECDKCANQFPKPIGKTPITALYTYMAQIEHYLITLGWAKEEILNSMRYFLAQSEVTK